MDTMNAPHADNPVGTPPCPTSQCSGPDQERKQPYLSTTSSANAVPSSSTDGATIRSPSATASPPPSCAICLGAFVNKCMPDICMHQFCFNCLLQWSKVKAECPLCKQPFLSIIHNVRSNYEYDEHFIERPPDPEYYLPNAPQPRHFQFRTTFTVDPRGELAIQQMLSSHPLTFPIELGVYNPFPNRAHRHADRAARGPRSDRRTYVSTQGYRRNLYEQDLWVITNQNGADSYREANPEYYRNNEGATTRLVPWLNRELLVLMQNPSSDDVTNLILQILTALPRHHIFSRYMLRDVLQPHLYHYTEHFAHEFYNFMRSPLDMIGYDRCSTHGPRVIENVILDDQSSDDSYISTVLLLDHTQSTASTSSTSDPIRPPLHMPMPFATGDIIEIPDSDGPDSDVILQTPPPPTIVDLLHDSSDSDVGSASRKVVTPAHSVTKQQHDAAQDTSSVQEVDCLDAGPSTSRGMKRRSGMRCTRHDEYVVDRKTVLPLKIRLKRKRHQPARRSTSKSYRCCKNAADGYSSSSSNDISLQSRLKRRRKFHKKKYMRSKETISSSDSSSSSNSSKNGPKQQQQQANNSFSSSDDDEPLSSIRKSVNMLQRSATGDCEPTTSISRSPTKVRTKREVRVVRGLHAQKGGTSKSTVVPPGVFEPSEPCRSPFFSSSPVSSPSINSQSSRYTPEPTGRTAAPHNHHRRNTPTQYPLCYFSSQPAAPHEYRYNPPRVPPSHTPPLPTRPYSPFVSAVQRRHDYYRSLAVPPWTGVGAPSTSAGGVREPFTCDDRNDVSYRMQRQHDPMYDPMWNGIRAEHLRAAEEDTVALTMRNCHPN